MKIRNIIHFVIGLTLSAIINVVTLPVMAWFYPQETIGKIAMLNVMITFSATLFSLGLDQAFVRWYHESDNKTEAFYNSFLPGAGALLCILLCLNIFFPDVILKIIDEDKTAISFMISFLIISGYCNRFLPIIFRMEEKGVLFSLSQLLPKGIFLILICILALSKNNNIELLILSLLFSFSLVTIISVFFAKDLLFPLGKIDIKKIHEMLHYSIPLLIGAISYWGLSSVDRLFIVKYSTYSELAIFSIAISFAGIANVAQSIFSTIWIPTVFKWIHQIKPVEKCYEKIDLVKNLISCISFFIVSIAGLFGWLLLYLLPYNYANIIYLIPLCMLSILFYAISETTIVGLSIIKKTKYLMLSSLLSFVINIIANVIVVPFWGAKGAAVSTAISFFAFLILRTEFSSYFWIKIKRIKLYTISMLWLIISILYCFYGDKYIGLFVSIWGGGAILIIIFYYKQIKILFDTVLDRITCKA